MAVTITQDNASATDLHRYAAEASDLGLPPGEWPRELPTTLGNRMPFVLYSLSESAARYEQANGCLTLTVWND